MEKSKFDCLKLENQLCFPLYAAAREVVKKYTPYLDSVNLTYTQYIAMMVLWENKEISAKQLGEKLFLDSGTLTPVLKSLENKGYVVRSRNKDDERVLIVKVTESGEALKEQALAIPQAMSKCLNLDDKEIAQLYSLLYKVLRG